LLLGVEADITFQTISPRFGVSLLATAQSDLTEQWDYVATARGRVGYAAGPWLRLCHRGGLAWAGERFLTRPQTAPMKGFEHPARLGRRRRPRIWLRAALERAAGVSLQPVRKGRHQVSLGTQYTSTLDFQSLRLGLNRKIDWPGSGNFSPASLADPESNRWEIHGQTTFLHRAIRRSCALFGSKQPDAGAAASADLEQ